MDEVTLLRRLVELERKVTYLFEQHGLDEMDAAGQPAAKPSPEVVALARSHRPLDAMRAYQMACGCSLDEARTVVDGLLH
jgi:hypothetical protein